MNGVEKPPTTPLSSLLSVLRAQLEADRLSDEDGRRLVEKVERIVRELARMHTRLN